MLKSNVMFKNKKIYSLGLTVMDNSAAALFCNGKLIAAVEEERLSRIKNDGSFPFQSIKEVLNIANINSSQINDVYVYWNPFNIFWRIFYTLMTIIINPNKFFYMTYRVKNLFFKKAKSKSSQNGSWIDLFFIKKKLKSKFKNLSAKIHYIDHHLSHQLYAEKIKNWNNFIGLSYDGGGEVYSTFLYAFNNGERKVLSKHKWPNSLGHFYSTFTSFLGFEILEGEYKMMGLAPYGSPIYKDIILNNILKLNVDGTYILDTKICDYHLALRNKFTKKLINLFGNPRIKNKKLLQRHVDIAASVQYVFEITLIHLLKSAKLKFPLINKLVLSGGCALNVTANGELLKSNLFKEIIIPPAPHDAGCAIGAVIAGIENKFKLNLNSIRNPYLGQNYSSDSILKEISKFTDFIPKKLDDISLIKKTVQFLIKGKIIAWFQHKSEFGPRALGARSFLADPRNDNIQKELNKKIKKRELFRPFAPSVTLEKSSKYFRINQDSPYMNIVGDVKTSSIPAVTHVNGTSRIHTVRKNINEMYFNLLVEFEKKTGVPVLLNTSLNIQEPIVYSPHDVLKTFLNSEADILVVDKFILKRENFG